MSIFKINHKEASEGGKKVEPGTYQATVKTATVKQSSTGNPMIVLDYEIRKDIEQPHGGALVRFDNLVMTEAAMWKAQTYAKAMGIPDGLEIDTYEELATIMTDRKVEIEVADRELTNGKVYAEVKRVKPAIDAEESEGSDSADPFSQGGKIDLSDDDLPF